MKNVPRPAWGWLASIAAALLLGAVSCGSDVVVSPRGNGEAGGSVSSSASSSSSSGAGGAPSCVLDDVSTWDIEAFDALGDHPRFATATSGVPWVALAVQGGNVILEKLGVGDQGIVVLDQFEIPQSPVYPLAFDANDKRFVLLTTTGNNWNGTLEVWLIDRITGDVLRQPVGDPSNPNWTIRAALALVDEDVAVAYMRPADGQGTIEIRNAKWELMASELVSVVDFQGVSLGPTAFDIYLGGASLAHIEGGSIKIANGLPDKKIIGGLGPFLVDIGNEFTLTNGMQTWTGPWPHTQISAPAIVRTLGETAVFAIETELTGVVGYPKQNGVLDWLRIESMPGASGIGVAVMPLIEERRLGLFYVGLEIPHPEQPLRYFGRVCH